MEINMICILSSSHHIIRDLKQRRRRRQQQQHKKKQLVLRAKQLLYTCITLFSKFLWRPLHDYDVKTSQCDVLWGTWTYYHTFSLFYLNMDKALKNSTSGNWMAYIWIIERFQIDAIEFERTQIHFLVMFSLPVPNALYSLLKFV